MSASASASASSSSLPPQSPSPPSSLDGIRTALGAKLFAYIQNSAKILVVGAGGIGCELLKNLALSGFRNVEVIDLDTIDVSNLNRQFLFRSRHVGMAKCRVACEVAGGMSPPVAGAAGGSDGDDESGGVKYIPHHGDVTNTNTFSTSYISSFSLVFNALDNVPARRHVNRLCLSTSTPLIEAGTTGYLGQVTVIHKPSGTECYECQSKPTAKVYPVCTIRSTPSRPVHCIVWAKELYKLIFGDRVEDSMLFEDVHIGKQEGGDDGGGGDGAEGEAERKGGGAAEEDEEKKTNGDKPKEGAKEGGDDGNGGDGGEGDGGSTYMALAHELRALLGGGGKGADSGSGSGSPSAGGSSDGESEANDTKGTKASYDEGDIRSKAAEFLAALYDVEIRKQIDMKRYEGGTKVPVPLSPDEIATACKDGVAPSKKGGYRHTDVWNVGECVAELTSCLVDAAKSRSAAISSSTENGNNGGVGVQGEGPPPTEFDKDHSLSMRFVTASSNLRSVVFSIEPSQSLYEAKGIAGNIIPAIATTNAVVAGLQVLQAFHVLRWRLETEERERADKEKGKVDKAGADADADADADAAVAKSKDGGKTTGEVTEVDDDDNDKATADADATTATKGKEQEGDGDGDTDESVKNLKERCRYVYCARNPTRRGLYLNPTPLPPPNPSCYVCRSTTLNVRLNTQLWTLDMLLRRILKRELNFLSPTVMVGGDLIYEEGDELDKEEVELYGRNLPKQLVDLPGGGIGDGAVVRVEDFGQDLEVELRFEHVEDWKEEGTAGKEEEERDEEEKFEIGGRRPVAAAAEAEAATEAKKDDDDGEKKKEEVEVEVEEGKNVDNDKGEGKAKGVDGGRTTAAAEGEADADGKAAEDDDDDDVVMIVDAPGADDASPLPPPSSPGKRRRERGKKRKMTGSGDADDAGADADADGGTAKKKRSRPEKEKDDDDEEKGEEQEAMEVEVEVIELD